MFLVLDRPYQKLKEHCPMIKLIVGCEMFEVNSKDFRNLPKTLNMKLWM